MGKPTISSLFNPEQQIERTESKTVAALERLSEAFRVLLWRVGKEHTVSPIAVQILTFVRFHKPELCTVGLIAQEFNMTKQTVSDAVITLENKGLIEKIPTVSDARIMTLRLTKEGNRLAGKVSNFAAPIENAILALSQEQQDFILSGLLTIVRNLTDEGIINTQRMCFSCRFYHENYNGNEHFCHLLRMPLVVSGLATENTTLIRLDCEEHQAA